MFMFNELFDEWVALSCGILDIFLFFYYGLVKDIKLWRMSSGRNLMTFSLVLYHVGGGFTFESEWTFDCHFELLYDD